MPRLLGLCALLATASACGVNQGPGITGKWFTYSVRVMDTPVYFDGSEFDAALIGIAPDGRPLFRDPAGIWLTDTDLADPKLLGDASIVLSAREHVLLFRSDGTVERTSDGVTYDQATLPAGLDEVQDVRADSRGTLYATGIYTRPSDISNTWGALYTSDDDGSSWELVIDTLFNPPGDALNGWANSVTLGAVDGFLDLRVCRVIDNCTVLRGLPGAFTTYLDQRDVPFGAPMPFGLDGDGRILASSSFDVGRGFTTPEIVVLDPDERDDDPATLDHFHTGFAPAPIEFVDHEGYGWGTSFDLETWGILRTVEPLGASHDQRAKVLSGPGCNRYYTYDPDYGYAGDATTMEITNGSGEPFGLYEVKSLSPQAAYPDGGEAIVAPGASAALDVEEEEWFIALTTDGRCKGYGMARKLDGKSL